MAIRGTCHQREMVESWHCRSEKSGDVSHLSDAPVRGRLRSGGRTRSAVAAQARPSERAAAVVCRKEWIRHLRRWSRSFRTN